ncbi:MAG TPA: hypothetical protein VHZ49_05625 [Methylomirabilota bacterium]|nr:hypothetical protein [Methylomirabilota bacterium]
MPPSGVRPANRSPSTFLALALLALGCALLARPVVLSAASPPAAADAVGDARSSADVVVTQDSVLQDLNAAIQWFRDARVTLRAALASAAVPLAGDEERVAREALDRAFAVARARSELVPPPQATAERSAGAARATEQRARLGEAIQAQQTAVTRLQARARAAAPAQRAALERELAGARNRLELDRARLAFLAQLQPFDAAQPGATLDLAHQIDTLRTSVPDVKPGAPAEPAVVTTDQLGGGTWALLHRLVALRQTRSSIDDVRDATAERRRSVEADLRATGAGLRGLAARLHELADTSDAPADMSAEQREFQASLERARALAAVVAPLQQESALLRRFGDDLTGWQRAIDAETAKALKGVGIDLLRLAAAIGAVFVAAALWRAATLRYVGDPFRRRLVLGARKVVVVIAVTVIVVVHFASELTTLVTALGFAAAGIAFALQNVILAVAGYFSMMAPNGIRVGDRVSLQGPFGYVHGEVLEIGFVRIRLRELAGDPLAPTGRMVVFPNSVVFTGSFFKHPEGAATAPGPPAHRAA